MSDMTERATDAAIEAIQWRDGFRAGQAAERAPWEAAYANLLAEHDRSLKAAHARWDEERRLLMEIRRQLYERSSSQSKRASLEAHNKWLANQSSDAQAGQRGVGDEL